MALGTIYSIDPVDNTKGEVKEDQTEQVYPFQDPNFPNLGLAVGAAVTYDIDYTARIPMATNIAAYVPVNTDITTPVNGPLTVNSGETMTIKNGGNVNGTINVNNGNLIIQGTGVVNGDVTVDAQGSVVARNGGNVNGTINVNNGSALKVVNSGKVNGTINVLKANRVIIGNANGGGIVSGSLTVDRIRKVTITTTSKFNCP